MRLDARTHLASGLEHAVHRIGVGHPHAVRIVALETLRLEDRFDLRPAAVRDDQVDAEAVQQVQVVDDIQEALVRDDLAAESDHERLVAERVHVRRRGADPVDERPHRRGLRRRRHVGLAGHGRAAGRPSSVEGAADYSVAAAHVSRSVAAAYTT